MKICFLRLILPALLAPAVFGTAAAVELPPPAELSAQSKLPSRQVSVVEPHASTNARRARVDYRALPIDGLLTRWFGERWTDEDVEIVFFAKDGYRSVVAGPKLKKYRAYLAFARADGGAFVVDNIGQNEKRIELGPYYLIWDNLDAPELLSQGAYGWPYQITVIESRDKNEDRLLRPRQLPQHLERGLQETKAYCLTCHAIRGIGGKKYALDLLQAACRWPAADLKAWIESPGRLKPGTTMPPLGRMLPATERRQISERIVAYLHAMQAPSSASCATK